MKDKKEIIIDGKKIEFYSARSDRRIRSSIKNKGSFFSKSNRHIHLTIINLILIFIAAFFVLQFYGKSSKVERDGFTFFLTKRGSLLGDKIILNFTVKNVLNEVNYLKFKKIIMLLYDENKLIIYKGETMVKKDIFKKNEYYNETFVTNKLKSGRYRASINIDDFDLLILDFEVK